MSDLELLANTMQEWSSTSGDHHMLAAAAIRQLIKLQAAQAQAGDEVTVKGFANGGSCAVVQGIAVYGLDVGDKLYTRPQPAVNQQLLEAIKIAIECLGLHGDGFVDLGAMTVLQDFVAAIKAAQEGK
jgi:hypothetical protein